MNIPLRKWAALLVCPAAIGAGAVFALAARSEFSPLADEKAAKEDWLPKPRTEKVGEVKVQEWVAAPSSAFPELAIPEGDPNDPKANEKRAEQFDKLCPRLSGKLELKIEADDDTLRKLLKARLHQGVWEMVEMRKIILKGNWTSQFREQVSDCIRDMQDAASELYAKDPKALVPWLEELLIQAKEMERLHFIRVGRGTDPPQRYNATVRDRLKIEEALLKAKKK
jgi:hypothetical protein